MTFSGERFHTETRCPRARSARARALPIDPKPITETSDISAIEIASHLLGVSSNGSVLSIFGPSAACSPARGEIDIPTTVSAVAMIHIPEYRS
jgi:hypothetical protein